MGQHQLKFTFCYFQCGHRVEQIALEERSCFDEELFVFPSSVPPLEEGSMLSFEHRQTMFSSSGTKTLAQTLIQRRTSVTQDTTETEVRDASINEKSNESKQFIKQIPVAVQVLTLFSQNHRSF